MLSAFENADWSFRKLPAGVVGYEECAPSCLVFGSSNAFFKPWPKDPTPLEFSKDLMYLVNYCLGDFLYPRYLEDGAGLLALITEVIF